MTDSARKILDEALGLPEEQREALVEALTDSLNLSPVEIDPEWKAEIHSRIAQIERGDVEPVSWSEVKRDMDDLLKRG